MQLINISHNTSEIIINARVILFLNPQLNIKVHGFYQENDFQIEVTTPDIEDVLDFVIFSPKIS